MNEDIKITAPADGGASADAPADNMKDIAGNDYSVSIRELSKVYKIYKKPWFRIFHAFTKRVGFTEFYALKNFNVDIRKGETVGIIGKNGNGKSTLLKLITGVTAKTSGSIQTDGRIVAMLELTAGFDKELTGRENIYLKGRTIGLSNADISSRIDDIIAFADIGNYIDQPIRTYSSGMKSRLGFAVSANLDPDILIVDEVLAVGDTAFKLKCLAKMEEFRKQGKTILFVSHDLSTIKAFCSSCMWIKNGELVEYGETGKIVQMYQDYLKEERKRENERRRKENRELIITKDDMVHPVKPKLLDSLGNEKTVFGVGEDIIISANYSVKVPTDSLICAVTVYDNEDREIFGSDRQGSKMYLSTSVGLHNFEFCIKHVALLPGHYTVTAEIWNPVSGFVREVMHKKKFEITSDYFLGTGIVALNCTCESR